MDADTATLGTPPRSPYVPMQVQVLPQSTGARVKMRPASLNPLFASLRDLNGVGERLEEAIIRLTGAAPEQPARVINLLWHFPSGIIGDSGTVAPVGDARREVP